jgi:cyclohexadienyl dehydratase
MDAQISAARELQETLRAEWAAGRASPPAARDLNGVIRPELDRIGSEMMAAVNDVAANGEVFGDSTKAAGLLRGLRSRLRISDEGAGRLAVTISALRRTGPAEVGALRRTGTVRVGLTGDYAPFSEERDGRLRGVDVDLGREFGDEFGARVIFVRTTWTRLMADLSAGRFDFAVGGISVTPERSQVAEFGPEYFRDGKTPIARCAERERFVTLEAIDQPGVRVVVNPGGTNERFARENLRRAEIRVFPDNRAIFGEILAGRADVMITDGIEVRLQAARNPSLCGTRQEPFTRSGKAWLFPRSAGLAVEAERWLAPRVAAGEVARRIDAAITDSR